MSVIYAGDLSQAMSSSAAINGLNADKALTNAGYFNFIWPTLLWQTGIAAVITGVFGFLFYKTWTYEEPNKKEKR